MISGSMVRPSRTTRRLVHANEDGVLDLKLDRQGVAPKDAATIIVVRNAARGSSERRIETFCVERSKQSRFLGGAIVFPGGKVDASDAGGEWSPLTTSPRPPQASSIPFTTSEAHLRALAIAACRETLEEAAMLHVRGRDGVSQDDLFALRSRLTTTPGALRELLQQRGMQLDLEALHPFARWVTPDAEARRYDARFFVAVAPLGQTGAHDEHETMASFWATPAEVLRRWDAGEVQVAPPTHRTLALLANCETTDDVIALANNSCLDPICPRLVEQVEGQGELAIKTMALVLPGDPEHDVRDKRVEGPSRYVLRGDRWLAEDAPR
jgi:8-oxo-dGTP pyrophosphatase MutT (NUDIX family)